MITDAEIVYTMFKYLTGKKGRCKLKCTSTWSDIRYGYIKACKRFFELKEHNNDK